MIHLQNKPLKEVNSTPLPVLASNITTSQEIYVGILS